MEPVGTPGWHEQLHHRQWVLGGRGRAREALMCSGVMALSPAREAQMRMLEEE